MARIAAPANGKESMFIVIPASSLAGKHGGVRVLSEIANEVRNGPFRVQADRCRVRADERPAEDSAGQARDVISLECVERCDGNQSAAARALGISRNKLARLLKSE